jgi:two-component system cell cycle sensor histidine kinase/response regulator CckA
MNAMHKVLIIEDEIIIATLLEHQLHSFNCKVVKGIIFGEDAAKAYELHKPDLVLMDIKLAGEMNGIAAARSILANHSARIAFMTAYGTDKIKHEIDTIPHVAYLEKPLTNSDLAKLISGL